MKTLFSLEILHKSMLEKFAYKESLTLFSYGGESLHVKIIPLDNKDFSLLSHSVILCNISLAKQLLGLERFEYSDFFVDVPNETEVPNIVAQIQNPLPQCQNHHERGKYQLRRLIFTTIKVVSF